MIMFASFGVRRNSASELNVRVLRVGGCFALILLLS